MTRDEIHSCAEQAVRQMCSERGFVIRPYAGGHVISGHRFCLPVQHLAYVTAEQLDAPWLLDEAGDEDEDISDLGIEALDGVYEDYDV